MIPSTSAEVREMVAAVASRLRSPDPVVRRAAVVLVWRIRSRRRMRFIGGWHR